MNLSRMSCNKNAISVFVLVTLCLQSVATALFNDPKKNNCPTVETVKDFDLEEYASKTYFIQRQQVTTYSPLETFYCNTATYNTGAKQWWLTASCSNQQVNNLHTC